MAGIKRITAKEFQADGYLQELNRCFLHPLGMALEVIAEDNGDLKFGEVWDYRDDPEGIAFHVSQLDKDFKEKARKVTEEIIEKYSTRREKLGYDIQPVDGIPGVLSRDRYYMYGMKCIERERMEQLAKHNYSRIHDSEVNNQGSLVMAAIYCLTTNPENYPYNWSPKYKEKLDSKSDKERLIIAGALIAAELDRIEYDELKDQAERA
jgi:hypothetical protein